MCDSWGNGQYPMRQLRITLSLGNMINIAIFPCKKNKQNFEDGCHGSHFVYRTIPKNNRCPDIIKLKVHAKNENDPLTIVTCSSLTRNIYGRGGRMKTKPYQPRLSPGATIICCQCTRNPQLSSFSQYKALKMCDDVEFDILRSLSRVTIRKPIIIFIKFDTKQTGMFCLRICQYLLKSGFQKTPIQNYYQYDL